jgi:Tfp pilus assembly protein PilF
MDAPFDPDLRYNIGICYLKAGDQAHAQKHLEKYLKLAPEGTQAKTVEQLLEGLEKKNGKETKQANPAQPGI